MPSLDFETEKAAFRTYHESHREPLEEAKNSFIALVSALLRDASSAEISKIEGRVKDKEECIQKFSRKYRPGLESSETPYQIADHISDLIGLRVVCLYEDQIAAIRDTLCDHFNVIGMTDKIANVENTEDSFGYKGLHLDVRLSDARAAMPEYRPYAGFSFEIQVRTIVQDSWSVLDHKIKYKKSIPNRLKRRINTLAALFELADREFREIRVATDEEIRRAQDEPEAQDDEPAELPAMELAETGVHEGGDSPQHAKQPSASNSRQRLAALDAFAFLRIANHFFANYEFEAHKVDGFVQEIIAADPSTTRAAFNRHLRLTIGHVKRYQAAFEQASGSKMNPFTVMRHCLYLSNKDKFPVILNNVAKETFEAWLTENALE